MLGTRDRIKEYIKKREHARVEDIRREFKLGTSIIHRHLIKLLKEGDIVFDPFMGVGSTGVAALNLDRKFIGVEIDEKYFKAAEKRLNGQPTKLFAYYETKKV